MLKESFKCFIGFGYKKINDKFTIIHVKIPVVVKNLRNLCSVKNKVKKYYRNIEIIRNFAEESSEKCINIAQNRTL